MRDRIRRVLLHLCGMMADLRSRLAAEGAILTQGRLQNAVRAEDEWRLLRPRVSCQRSLCAPVDSAEPLAVPGVAFRPCVCQEIRVFAAEGPVLRGVPSLLQADVRGVPSPVRRSRLPVDTRFSSADNDGMQRGSPRLAEGVLATRTNRCPGGGSQPAQWRVPNAPPVGQAAVACVSRFSATAARYGSRGTIAQGHGAGWNVGGDTTDLVIGQQVQLLFERL
jgi:hypothetical protein